MQRHLYEHFTVPGRARFLNEVSVAIIDKRDPKNPTKCEGYWIQKLKTKAPLELNVEDGLQV